MEENTFDAPTWLDKEFIATLLRDNDDDSSIDVLDVTVRPAVGKGENYSSCLHRVAVTLTRKGGNTENRSLIVKSLPTSELISKMLIEGGIFDSEKMMYFDILPALYELQENSPGAGVSTFSPRVYKTTRPHTIVMDDLSQLGFKMAERHSGLDLTHTKVALGAMARLHALSIGLVAKDPTSMDSITEPFYSEVKKAQNEKMMTPGVMLLASFVEKWSGFERFGDKLRNVAWVDLITEMAKVKEGDIAVLNHGDAWTNNMLFQYSETGEVKSIKFVDFQIGRFASPAMDLQYFMHTSPSEVVREEHWVDVIEDYYKNVVETLKAIGCESKTFSFEKLKEEIQERMMYGLFTACVILPIVLADPQDAPDLSNMSEDHMEDNIHRADFGKSYNAKRFKGVFEKVLLHFETMGII